VIGLANTPYQLALRQRYIAGLARQYAVATNYSEISNPSLPNYLAMTSGSTWGIRDDLYHTLPATGLGQQLSAAGISWKAYLEGFTGDCFNSPYPYSLQHNPFAYYGGACPANVVPMTDLVADLNGDTPLLSWITPGLCHQAPHKRLNAARGTEYRNDIIDITLCVGVTSHPLLSVRRAPCLIRAAACRNRRPGGDRPLCREPAGRSWSRSRRPRPGGDLATRPLERRDLPSGSPLERGAG